MQDPYAHYNEMFHPNGIPAQSLQHAAWPDLAVRMPVQVKQRRIKAQRVRSFEIACTLVAGEMQMARVLG